MATQAVPIPATARQPTVAPPSARPVLLWAVIGAGCLLVTAAGFLRWLTSGDLVRTPPGPDHLAGWKMACLRTLEIASPILAVYLCWRFLLRPLLRQRTLTLDGMIVLGGFLLWFYDPMVNYFNFSFAYNAHFVNLGSWANFIPGWEAPNQARLAEPLLFVSGAYIWYILGASLFGCAVLRRTPEKPSNRRYWDRRSSRDLSKSSGIANTGARWCAGSAHGGRGAEGTPRGRR